MLCGPLAIDLTDGQHVFYSPDDPDNDKKVFAGNDFVFGFHQQRKYINRLEPEQGYEYYLDKGPTIEVKGGFWWSL